MAVKGIGARRARMIWQALGVATLDGLAVRRDGAPTVSPTWHR
jgi:hypothetical protein